ncbi:hypothetical protein G7Y89_g12985 [Cudoniella acicularis]|uniref:Uncharacterized protein n=1 Tax=Cudoniella acicularis TaxID=354080 RepID=A0A8H4VZ47_9HELO|nr:hypothetical protein G7Y89_g12985 [Cudoniella acicularis]
MTPRIQEYSRAALTVTVKPEWLLDIDTGSGRIFSGCYSRSLCHARSVAQQPIQLHDSTSPQPRHSIPFPVSAGRRAFARLPHCLKAPSLGSSIAKPTSCRACRHNSRVRLLFGKSNADAGLAEVSALSSQTQCLETRRRASVGSRDEAMLINPELAIGLRQGKSKDWEVLPGCRCKELPGSLPTFCNSTKAAVSSTRRSIPRPFFGGPMIGQ